MQQSSKNDILIIIIKRFLISLIILISLRIGLELPIPTINYQQLLVYEQTKISDISRNSSSLLNLSIFNLSISPYLNASILIQILRPIIPELTKLKKEGLYGKRNLNDIIRRLTLFIALIQSGQVALSLKKILSDWNFELGFIITISLTTGAMIVFWLSEFITDYGLGNGPSLFVAFNIVSSSGNLLSRYYNYIRQLRPDSVFLAILIIITALFLIIFLQLCWLKIPLISAKMLSQKISVDITNNIITDGLFLPLRLDIGGIFPIILTGSVLYVLDSTLLPIPTIKPIYQFFYWIIFFSLNGIFNAFISLFIINPKTLSRELQESAVTIENLVSSSKITIPVYLKSQTMRGAFTGSIILSLICVLSNLLTFVLPIPELNKFGLTSMLILVNVINEIRTEVDDIKMSNKLKNY